MSDDPPPADPPTPTPSPQKADWVVTVRETVVKEIYCVDCTEAEARADPYGHESTTDVADWGSSWEVLGVEREPGEDSDG